VVFARRAWGPGFSPHHDPIPSLGDVHADALDRDGSTAAFFAHVNDGNKPAAAVTAATPPVPGDPMCDPDFAAAVQRSRQQALQHYPGCMTDGSPLHSKIPEIGAMLKQHDNPIVNSPDAPFKITQMAANELGIAPLP